MEYLGIIELKNKAHDLLDEYVNLHYKNGHYFWGNRNIETSKAYSELYDKTGKQCHFGDMKSEGEVLNAIAILNSMIVKRKAKQEAKRYVLSREDRLKALAELV